MEARERVLWTAGIAVVALGIVVGVVAIALVRFADVPAEPWLYIGIAVGMVSALAGGGLAFIRAKEWSG